MAELLNITETAERLGLSLSMTANYARRTDDTRLRTSLIGSRRFVSPSEIKRFAAWHEKQFGTRRNGGKRKRGAVRASRERTT